MEETETFRKHIEKGYSFQGESILLGTSVLNGQPQQGNPVRAPLATFNRHGLVAGATGTGKTKTLQGICEKLSEKGVPVLIMDIKGDVSGLAQPGQPHPKVDERHQLIGVPWKADSFPVELLSISDEPGVKLRATISEFGPVLLSKILELNNTQSGVISLVFKYCDDKKLPLLDIKDLRKTLQYLSGEGKKELEKEYGRISSSSIGAIMRNLVALEEQGADRFFGERSFDVADLTRVDERGYGYINILRLTDIQGKPRLFSTFMLCLLAEIYQTFPEQGDLERPELVVFIDEAHLIFEEASDALLDQIGIIIKLIRSKGIGIFFCTQNPDDVPAAVLGQLGMKVQHALRAFTARDRKAIKAASENYPLSDFYKTNELLTQLGTGEALVTVLNEKGVPTPLVHTLLTAPASRMDILKEEEIQNLVRSSALAEKYNEVIDRESAYEMLVQKMDALEAEQSRQAKPGEAAQTGKRTRPAPSTLERMVNSTAGRTVIREVTRGILGVLGVTATRKATRRRKGGGLFDLFK